MPELPPTSTEDTSDYEILDGGNEMSESERRQRIFETIAALKEFRKGHKLNGLSLRSLIEKGRR